jgi:hypothetical protein
MTTICVQYSITAPHLKKPWVAETVTVNGETFIKLSKWDRGFVRFLTSRALDFRNPCTYANFAFIDHLCDLRDKAFDDAARRIAEQATNDAQEAGDATAKKRRVRAPKARVADRAVLPAALMVQCPAVEQPCDLEDETALPEEYPSEIKVLVDGLRTRSIFMLLTVNALNYVRQGCMCSELGRTRRRAALCAEPDAADDDNGAERPELSLGSEAEL